VTFQECQNRANKDAAFWKNQSNKKVGMQQIITRRVNKPVLAKSRES
jgi:hypothetical protein